MGSINRCHVSGYRGDDLVQVEGGKWLSPKCYEEHLKERGKTFVVEEPEPSEEVVEEE